MAILFAATPVLMFGGCGIAALLGSQSYRTWGIARLLAPVTALIGLLIAVAAEGRTAGVVAAVIVGSSIVQAAAVARILIRRRLVGKPQRAAARDLLSYGWRQLVTLIGWLLTYKLDQIVLSIAAAPAALGLYAVGATIGDVIVSVAAFAGPVMLARGAIGGARNAQASLAVALVSCIALSATAAVIAFVTAPQLLALLFGDAFVPAEDVLRILLPGAIALSVASVLADTLRGLGLPLEPAKAEAAGAICSVALLAALIPPFGIRGAAIASTASYTLVMVVLGVLLRSRLRMAP